MGLVVSASLNANGNSQIYGSDTYQSGVGQPIVANPLVHRIVVEKSATSILINVTPVNTVKVVDDAATATSNAAFLASVNTNTGLTCTYNGASNTYTFSGSSITPNRSLYYQDVYYVDTTTGTDSLYGTFTFVFTDATTETHKIFITSNETLFKITQGACTNQLTLAYQDALYDYQNPLDNWGAIDKGVIKYEYSIDNGVTWNVISIVDTLTEVSHIFSSAYKAMQFRATRTITDSTDSIIYESIANNFLPAGLGHVTGFQPFTVYDMTECVPSPTVIMSDLYCECKTLDITDSTSYQNRKNWFSAVYTRNIVAGTPYYKGPEVGDKSNPSKDSKWSINIPFNGAYTFQWILVYKHILDTSYSLGDWVFNPADNKLYVSLSNTNSGHTLDNLVYWRQWNYIQDIETAFTKTANTVSNSFFYVNKTKTITCNSAPGVVLKMSKSCESTCSEFLIKDTTGLFDFNTNATGYGAPNTDRVDFGYYATLRKQMADKTTIYLPVTYNPTGAVSYLFDITTDGWYRFQLYQAELYNSAITYGLGDIRYDEDTQNFYKSLLIINELPLSNKEAWQTDLTSADFDSGNVYDTPYWDYLVTCNSEKILSSISEAIQKKCSNDCKEELVEKWAYLFQYLCSARIAMKEFRFTDAQCIMQMIPKNCAPYTSGKGGCGC